MNTTEMIKLNNERRELLNKENLKVYEDAMIYIRLNARSEYATESILLELLEHLIEAQQHGKSAKDVFGDDLHVYCDTLIADIPHQSKQSWLLDILRNTTVLLGSLFAVYTIVQLLSYFIPSLKMESLSLLPFLVIIAVAAIAILVVLYALKASIFRNKSWFIVGIAAYVAAVGGFVYATILFEGIWTIPINFWSCLAVTIVLILLHQWFKRLSRKADLKPSSH
ncbi:DUF1129 family protein [Paenibacillus sanguinis]|uniref:DUF1129 family protein n=1 Tax=Paenibacillus sanguinis TaxID=225906 RepID=UPI00036B8462|nr:DUF1129 family protein [Paenibacillus sanguinis]